MMTTVYRITGQTYEFQSTLKGKLGMAWNKDAKAWETTDKGMAEKAVNPTYSARMAHRLKLTVVEI
jgi:hypothetical protein